MRRAGVARFSGGASRCRCIQTRAILVFGDGLSCPRRAPQLMRAVLPVTDRAYRLMPFNSYGEIVHQLGRKGQVGRKNNGVWRGSGAHGDSAAVWLSSLCCGDVDSPGPLLSSGGHGHAPRSLEGRQSGVTRARRALCTRTCIQSACTVWGMRSDEVDQNLTNAPSVSVANCASQCEGFGLGCCDVACRGACCGPDSRFNLNRLTVSCSAEA